jgi:hypothetical protein
MSNSNEQSHLGTKLNYVIKFILLFPPQRVGLSTSIYYYQTKQSM